MKITKFTAICLTAFIISCLSGCATTKETAKNNEGTQNAEVKVEETVEGEKNSGKSKKSRKKANKTDDVSGWKPSKAKPIDVDYGSVKLRAKPRMGTFNVAIIDAEKNKVFPAFSSSNEFTTTGFTLKAGEKIIKLNEDTRVKYSAWKTDTGMVVGYRIENIADVLVDFECFQSNQNYDIDTVKVTVTVTNMGKKKNDFAVKAILDTILGETDRHHFYTCENLPVKNEISLRNFEENPWYLSKNSTGALQLIFAGQDATTPELLAFANFSTLNNRGWEPDLLTYRAFDTVLSYNNSACGILWPKHSVPVKGQFSEVFYLSIADGDRIPSGAEYLGVAAAGKKTADYNEEKLQDNEKEPVVEKSEPESKTYTNYDLKTLTQEQLSSEYIQKLLKRIEILEESDASLNKDELLQLNAELDAILETLRM